MEGYLFKRARGENSFISSLKWQRRWFILDNDDLVYYEDFDNIRGVPINKKGYMNVKSCKVIITNPKRFEFNIIHPFKKKLCLKAMDDKFMRTWITAFENAFDGKYGPVFIDYDECFHLLDLNVDFTLSANDINKAYRKKALRAHPDKGGDIDEFKRIQAACKLLLDRIDEEEKKDLYYDFVIEAKITKGPVGVGFGMIVHEDPKTRMILIKSIIPSIDIIELKPSTVNSLKPKDRLIRIDNDDVSSWPIARIVQRLSDYRVAIGNVVTFQFSRKLRHDGVEEIDEAEEEEARYRASEIIPTEVPLDSTAPESHNTVMYADQSVQYDATEEVSDLKEECDFYKESHNKLSEELQEIKSQMSQLHMILAESLSRNEYYELQLIHSMRGHKISEESLRQSMKDMILVSSQVKSSRQLPISIETKKYLEKVKSDLKEYIRLDGDGEIARSTAIQAVTMVDRSGQLLQKWTLYGEDFFEKIRRLDERLAKK